MTHVASYDPGLITGFAYGSFTETEPLELLTTGTLTYDYILHGSPFSGIHPEVTVVEEFILRDNEFKADLTGVRVEGILEIVFRNIVWRPPSKKAQVPDQVLKDHGLWQTGKTVDWEDGRDANDAIIHLLGYVAFDLRHKPTLRKYFR